MVLAWSAGVLCLEACEHFQKGSYRNRCHLAGPNGLQRLSIPLEKGKHQQTPIRAVRIAYHEPWQQVHWRSIRTAYGNAPFFAYYADELAVFYETRFEFLFDFNLELFYFLARKMGWRGDLQLTNAYAPKQEAILPGEGLVDFRDTISPGNHTLPGWFLPRAYPQVFAERHGFIPGLSALDLLLCQGKHAGELLAQSLHPSFQNGESN